MALYNNGYPATYQPMFYPQQYQATPPAQANSSIIWVQGEAGAKSYLVAPNTTVQLWDSEAQTIYLKSADASGMPSVKVLDYTIREATRPAQAPVVPNGPEYVTKAELDAIRGQIDAVKAELEKRRRRLSDDE